MATGQLRTTIAALLCVILGVLLVASTCWADDPWPDPVDASMNGSICSIWANYCFPGPCQARRSPDPPTWPDSYYTCGSTLWNSLNRVQERPNGTCQGSGMSCTYYAEYACARVGVYGASNNCVPAELKCKWWVVALNSCPPQ